jgi:hypothetical protein
VNMTEDDRIIRSLVNRIQELEQRMDELQRHQVGWKVRTAHLPGAFPRRSPDGAFRYSQPIMTVRSR